jgi:uncharacterized OB-fold protein
MCPHCHSLESRARDLAGTGTVYSFAILHHPQNPAFDYPVLAALVELDEGVRLMSNLVGVSKDDIRVGMRVSVEFVPTVGDRQVPVFHPVEAARR